MNWKNRLKNYNFWISMFSAVLLILQALKIKFDVAYVNEIFTAVLGLLVVVGIIIDPTKITVKSQETTETKQSEEKPLPVVAENETGDEPIQNDFQTVIAEIKMQINESMKELKKIEDTKPAVAEEKNPYVDVIN